MKRAIKRRGRRHRERRRIIRPVSIEFHQSFIDINCADVTLY
jgi:hypothetical protein